MKKYIFIVLFVLLLLLFQNKDEYLRVRIIANSNSEYDQKIKQNISSEISSYLYELLKDETNINIVRNKIKDNIKNIEYKVQENLNNEYGYSVDYGYHYFPEKTYKKETFKEGKYESLLITLGEGQGDNWWCIMFPPFCLVEAEESDKIEYSFFFDEIFTKIFK